MRNGREGGFEKRSKTTYAHAFHLSHFPSGRGLHKHLIIRFTSVLASCF